eukprot:s2727_g1.t1
MQVWILTFYFWTASLWSLLNSSWQSLGGSLLFSLGVVLSCFIMSGNVDNDWVNHMGNMNGFSHTFLVVAHCNVHPFVLLVSILVNFMGNFGSIWLVWSKELTDS